jgi:hypothetical protein
MPEMGIFIGMSPTPQLCKRIRLGYGQVLLEITTMLAQFAMMVKPKLAQLWSQVEYG